MAAKHKYVTRDGVAYRIRDKGVKVVLESPPGKSLPARRVVPGSSTAQAAYNRFVGKPAYASAKAADAAKAALAAL